MIRTALEDEVAKANLAKVMRILNGVTKELATNLPMPGNFWWADDRVRTRNPFSYHPFAKDVGDVARKLEMLRREVMKTKAEIKIWEG